ncbi:ribosome small subunit-dependent GTPase A [Oceanispirochaeta sp.]|jgi:ribosome biogenesis GTPase|uniref:ribosome small subunit-dependent GTPase A n=1 Tax=Oceanispirochaeta sp. TaxID=2035350 RepID=UPI00263968D9|nr:ribosome small subunit-dependent GTPase A [Oceanispirochaeta sp.]MDA3955424.1 ribosome small subunit-dependent GTPase A [Oceanispirochaeta sp.]
MNNHWGICPHNVDIKEQQMLGRVIENNREFYLIAVGDRVLRAELKGSLRYHSQVVLDLPVTGDWVILEHENDRALICKILPRSSVLSRKVAGPRTEEQPIAANIHYVGIVLGLDGGRNYSTRKLERYLTIAWNSGAQPIVILNKSDLCENRESIKREAEFIAPGVDVLLSSAQTGEGIDDLNSMLSIQKTILLIGPSGVGKSALTNRLLGKESQRLGENRFADKRGRHTTTCAQMVLLPQGGQLIDTPGLKEIQLWGSDDGLDTVFQEISDIAASCRFRDCSHTGEPSCAVQKALSEGSLDQGRYLSYLELKKELDYLESRQNSKAYDKPGTKDKYISKFVKEMKNGKVIY